jgi:hypothetical protein
MKRTITKSEIYQEFNLKELLGESPTTRQMQVFYELAVDKMVDRTVSNQDVKGKQFPDYEPKYADFKGVPKNSVDLVLSGDMLDSFTDSIDGDIVRISVDEGQAGKAHGNITGSYGKPVGVPEKERDFFGFVNKRDLDSIINIVKEIAPQDEDDEPFEIDLADLRTAVEDVFIDFGEIE